MYHLLKHRKLKSFDGTPIDYQVIGNGKKTVVLCNGLGGSVVAWKPLINSLGRKYRFISWDYRGLFRSGTPSDKERLTIFDHASDLHEIIKKEKIRKAVIGGWSMGVQVALEYYRVNPSAFSGLILVNGTYGYPFDTALNSPLSRFILPTVNDLAKKILPLIQPSLKPLAGKVINWEGFVDLVARLGLVHANLDKGIFREVASDMMETDLGMYHEIMAHLSEHDAHDVLATITKPTLIIAGDQDKMTPVKVAEEMADVIPSAQLLIIAKGSHYTLLEFPETLNLRVKSFLDDLRG